jgi:hypothetical protein
MKESDKRLVEAAVEIRLAAMAHKAANDVLERRLGLMRIGRYALEAVQPAEGGGELRVNGETRRELPTAVVARQEFECHVARELLKTRTTADMRRTVQIDVRAVERVMKALRIGDKSGGE